MQFLYLSEHLIEQDFENDLRLECICFLILNDAVMQIFPRVMANV